MELRRYFVYYIKVFCVQWDIEQSNAAKFKFLSNK